MLPTLRPGDRLLVDRHAYRRQPPAARDIVVVVDPTEPSRWLVKRVVAVGPATLGGADFGPPASGQAPGGPRSESGVAPIDVPAGAVWVQGDAGGDSRDSRQFGPLLPESVIGRAYRCYAPPDRRRPL
ncbi:MAG: S26 family signal peptidase [Thermoplasmata archaeon]|nr:S26 family signal peptidase [Thermoplasmata archaeon]